MRVFLLLACLANLLQAMAQPFAIGNAARDFFDADRNRTVPCDIHYPATVDGDEAPFAEGSFPVIVIGHGFVMSVDAYAYLWEHFVPLGYIVVLPTTEGDLSPDHAAFGADLAFVAQRMTVENADAGSAFFGHVSAGRVLAGHSMGGGAALLGAAGNAQVQAVMVLAPAETDPSAIAAAAQISAPTLVFAADEDCVTPIASNQQPMYEAVSIPCKAMLVALGGGHCYFGDDNFLCSFGELTCGPDLSITRVEQHDIVTDLGTLWLDGHVRNDAGALAAFEDSVAVSARIAGQQTCLSTSLAEPVGPTMEVVLITGDGTLSIESATPLRVVRLVNTMGAALPVSTGFDTRLIMDTRALVCGRYNLVLADGAGNLASRQFVVVR